ncbi:MAG: tagatose 1,6-diphosphate aldolase [Candidatus Omnitrophica bacterium]|nr:tagatose 1,6-diphosphate aldolase [Candidatus Omnitrophota bacterium]
MVKISKGKLRGLKAVSDSRGIIRAAAMDQRGSLQKSIAKGRGVTESEVTRQMMEEFKVEVSKALTSHASAILLDPEFGLPAVKARDKRAGVLLAYEKTGYDNTAPGRLGDLIEGWNVKRLKENGADCIKILIYYTPLEKPEINEEKHDWIENIGKECAENDMPFFLEFVGYDVKGRDEKKDIECAKIKPEIVMKSMQEFSKDRYRVDVLKVEIPVNMKFVEGAKAFRGKGVVYTKKDAMEIFRKVSGAAKRPFIYLSAGVSDEEFRESLELALESGVHFNGVLCGRATWAEGVPAYCKGGTAAFREWLNDRGVANIKALNAVLEKAYPWYDAYGGLSMIQEVSATTVL